MLIIAKYYLLNTKYLSNSTFAVTVKDFASKNEYIEMQQTILWIYEFQFQVFLFNFSSLAESKVNSLRKVLISTWLYAHTYNIEISIPYILSHYEYILHVPDQQNFVFPATNHIFMMIACYEYKFNIKFATKRNLYACLLSRNLTSYYRLVIISSRSIAIMHRTIFSSTFY